MPISWVLFAAREIGESLCGMGGYASARLVSGMSAALLVTTLPHLARAQSKGRDQVRPDRTDKETPDAASGLPASYANALRLARMINDNRTVAMLLARYGLTKSA